jgi:DNA-binding LacI/PurR family transcriptional regulator
LTTIKQDYDALGSESIHYLVELIKNQETSSYQRVLKPSLVVRQSTASYNESLFKSR